MKNMQINQASIGQQDYNLVEKVEEDINILEPIVPSIPTSLPYGISIVDGYGKVIPSSQASTWDESMGLTGIGVKSNNDHSFIFGVADNIINTPSDDGSINTSKEWSSYLLHVSVGNGITSTTSLDTAKSDFNSKNNTDAIIVILGSDPETNNAARVCRNYSAGVIGVGQWDLPALGVLTLIDAYNPVIRNIMTTINKSYWNNLLVSYSAWSSTQYSPQYAWNFDFSISNPTEDSKTRALFVIPVYTIN